VFGAHLSGFSAQSAFNTLMQAKPFRGSIGTAIIALLLSAVFLITLMHVNHLLQRKCIYPKLSKEVAHICSIGTRESDNEMLGLCIGFCVSQVLRFAVRGSLPGEIAHFNGTYFKDICYGEAWLLFLFAVLCGFASCGILKLEAEYGKRKQHATMDCERYVEFVRLSLLMSMAWNLLYCAEWNLVLMFGEHVLDRKELKHVILALVISYFTMVIIFGLDVLANKLRSPIMLQAGRLLGKSFGLAVAFSWEITFDVSVDTIADSEEIDVSGTAMKIVMAIFLIALVAPAWMKYILPNAMEEPPKPSFGEEDTKESETIEDSEGKFVTQSVQTQETGIDCIFSPIVYDEHRAHSAEGGRAVRGVSPPADDTDLAADTFDPFIDGIQNSSLDEHLANSSGNGRDKPVVNIADVAALEVDTVDPLTGKEAQVVDVMV
jgi:hypothetical protein